MRDNPKMWAVISVLLFIAGGVSWQIGEWQERQKLKQETPDATNNIVLTSNTDRVSTDLRVARSGSNSIARSGDGVLSRRLTNTDKSLAEIIKSPSVILLQNAIIDTSNGRPLQVPEILQAPTDTRSFIVQARGALNDTIRNGLKAAKATIVSYIGLLRAIPNSWQRYPVFRRWLFMNHILSSRLNWLSLWMAQLNSSQIH